MNTTKNYEELIENYREEVFKKVKTIRIKNYYDKCLSEFRNYSCNEVELSKIIDTYILSNLNVDNINNISNKNRTNYEKVCLRCLLTLKEYEQTGTLRNFMTYRKDYIYLIENEVIKNNRLILFNKILSSVFEIQKERSSYTTLYEHCRIWYKFYKYLISQNCDYNDAYANKFLLKYMSSIPNNTYGLSYTQRLVLRAITLMKEQNNHTYDYENIRYCKLKDNNILLKQYKTFLEENNFSWRTIQTRILFARRFLTYLNSQNIDLSRISIDNINDYFKIYELYKSKRGLYSTTKLFLVYLYQNRLIEKPIYLKIDNKKMPSYSLIPSVWKEDELEQLLNAIDNTTPLGKRNYAILMIAIKLGIRACDIFNLKFKNINWNKNYIEFYQSKTNDYVQLPLFNSVGNAIIDYIKNGRPECDLEYIFIRHRKPYKKLITIYVAISKYIDKAKLDFSEHHKKGIHSFRHTVGSNLLNKNIPLDTITPILGHSNKTSTITYLKCDEKNLKECFISLDGGDIDA